MTRGAHRALLPGVDVDVLVRALAVGKLVDVRQREVGACTGTTGPPACAVERGEHAVSGDSRFDLRGCRRAIAAVEMFLFTIEAHLHRCLRALRQPRGNQAFGADLRLAAESATHVLTDDADVRLRDAEALRKLLRG